MEADRAGTATALAARTGNIRDANDFPCLRKRGRAALAPAVQDTLARGRCATTDGAELLEPAGRQDNLPALSHCQNTVPAVGRRLGMMLCVLLGLAVSGRREVMAQTAAGREEARPERVLMLYNEGRESSGNMTMQQAFQAELQNLSTNRIDFFQEHLYGRHFPDRAHFQLFQDYLGKKYTGQKLDLIMVFPGGDYALAGALPEALFPVVPVVFVTANELEVPYAITKLGVTGIIQRYDIRGTLELIRQLQPDIRRVVVVGGNSEVDRATLDRIRETARSGQGFDFVFWTNRLVMDLPADVKTLPAGTAILASTFERDVAGQPFSMAQAAQMMAGSASAPIYVLGGYSVGSGVVGGVVVDSENLGRRGGQLAYRVMSGVDPVSVPIEVLTKGTPVVDWRALQRWHIDERRVPADCVVRYRPVSLWSEYRRLILISLAVFLGQALTITGLLVQRHKRRRAEREITSQRTALAHVSRVSTMGQLASALVHELNQPLGAILRNAEAGELFLMKEKPDWEEIRALLADIRKDDQRAGLVIERMRTLLTRRQVDLKSLDLGELLKETVTLAEPDARARQVGISLQLPARLPAVRGDRVHLQQVLLNLILNGMDAMAEVAIEARSLTVRAEPDPDGKVQVSVSDGGTGISPDNLERLFEPFFTTKPEGLGMGLAISRTIIEAHGGKIRAVNNATRGAVFKFTLPAEEPRP